MTEEYRDWKGGTISITISGEDLKKPHKTLREWLLQRERDKSASNIKLLRKTIREGLFYEAQDRKDAPDE